MKRSIINLSLFVGICTVITMLLALTNFITEPLILQNQNESANKALLEVMPEGGGFEAIDISSFTLPKTVSEVYRETNGKGHVIKLITQGYGSDMVIMCGVDDKGVVTGAVCISSNETLGKEKTYGESFGGKDATGVEAVEVIAGATKTTAAYKNAVKDALNSAIILGGGSVDVRTEEEILADNLSNALPEAKGEFERLFMTEYLEGVDSVYRAIGGEGYVFVTGESFIGVLKDGTVITEGVENAEEITAATELIKSSSASEIDLSAYPELSKTVVAASKTASGNFIIETKGAGYGIKGGNEYHPASGEYIIMRTALTADGKIIDCLTVSQAETKGLGDACAERDFYGQFVGKNSDNYTEIDAIAGATLTTDGCKQAIERAYSALEILKGGER